MKTAQKSLARPNIGHKTPIYLIAQQPRRPSYSGRQGLKRIKSHKLKLAGLDRPSIRRLARRGGVKRLSGDIYGTVKTTLQSWLEAILHDVAVFAEAAKRKTVIVNDVLLSLKRNGITLLGFDTVERRRRLTLPLTHRELQVTANRNIACHSVLPSTSTAATALAASQQQQQASAAHITRRTSSSAPSLDLTRILDIQTSLSSFRDLNGNGQLLVPNVINWISGDLEKKGRAGVDVNELMQLVDALKEREVLFVDRGRLFFCN